VATASNIATCAHEQASLRKPGWCTTPLEAVARAAWLSRILRADSCPGSALLRPWTKAQRCRCRWRSMTRHQAARQMRQVRSAAAATWQQAERLLPEALLAGHSASCRCRSTRACRRASTSTATSSSAATGVTSGAGHAQEQLRTRISAVELMHCMRTHICVVI